MQIDRQKHTELVKADSCSFRQFINTYTIYFANRSDEGLTLETSAFLHFTVANLRFKLSC